MGYPNDSKGYKVYNIDSKKFARSRNVIFHENTFHDFNVKEGEMKQLTMPLDGDEIDIVKKLDVVHNEGGGKSSDDDVVQEEFADGTTEPVNEDVTGDEDTEINPQITESVIEDVSGYGNIVGDNPTAPEHGNRNAVPENTNKQVFQTYEETFMNQVEHLGGRRERRTPKRFLENANIAYNECHMVESLT